MWGLEERSMVVIKVIIWVSLIRSMIVRFSVLLGRAGLLVLWCSLCIIRGEGCSSEVSHGLVFDSNKAIPCCKEFFCCETQFLVSWLEVPVAKSTAPYVLMLERKDICFAPFACCRANRFSQILGMKSSGGGRGLLHLPLW